MSNHLSDILNLPGVINTEERFLLEHLARYGKARDRKNERLPRTLTITDDQAIILLDLIGRMYGGPDQPHGS